MTATQYRDVDVLVVGAGTGMLAAINAASLGLSTLLIEKSPYLGGSTSISGGGFWVPNNSILREHKVPDTPERAETYLDALVGPLGDVAPRARWMNFLKYGPAAIDVLRYFTPNQYQPMNEYPDYFTEVPGGSPRGRAVESTPLDVAKLGDDRELLRPSGMAAPVPMPITGEDFRWMNLMTRSPKGGIRIARRASQGIGGKVIGKELVAGGQALGAGLMLGLRKLGVEALVNTPLTELIVKDGKVTGAVVERNGEKMIINASRGIVLSSGGFERNQEMRAKYQHELLDGSWSMGAESNTGDVHQIAEGIGAELVLMDQAWWFPILRGADDVPNLTLLADRSLPGSIVVDQHGKRFMNEAVNYMSAGQTMLGQDDGGEAHYPLWMVFDQRHRNRYLLATAIFPRQQLPQAWYDAGVAKKGRSIDDLAKQLEMPELTATVERFNLLAGQGHDDDYQRGLSYYDHYYSDPTVTPNPNLAPLDQAPYYAVTIAPGDLGTCGGIRADEFGRALKADGDVIEGLYAVGNAAGNVFGKFYPGPGCTIGQGLVYSYIATQHLAGQL